MADDQSLSSDETIEAFRPFENFCRSLLDAYAVIDSQGRVVKSNQLLASLLGIPTKQILKLSSLDERLQLSFEEKPLQASLIYAQSQPMRFDEVRGQIGNQTNLNFTIGTFPLTYKEKKVGAFILIRDVTAETNLQGKYLHKATESMLDGLTELYNRKTFFDHLESHIGTIKNLPQEALQRCLSVIMIDIDHFKSVNDVYGHQAGDSVIRETAKLMKQFLRKTDFPARYGGEEFVALLPGTDLMGAIIAGEKIREAVERFQYLVDNKRLPVTISVGVAQINVGEETGSQAVSRADEALYHSKRNGRNRVSCHSHSKAIGIADLLDAKSRSA